MTAGRLSLGNARRTSKPSIPGIWMSRNTTSGDRSTILSTADCPSPHSPTISTSLNFRSLRTTPRRAKGSSSTISARTVKPPPDSELCVTAVPAIPRNRPHQAKQGRIQNLSHTVSSVASLCFRDRFHFHSLSVRPHHAVRSFRLFPPRISSRGFLSSSQTALFSTWRFLGSTV